MSVAYRPNSALYAFVKYQTPVAKTNAYIFIVVMFIIFAASLTINRA